MSRMCRAGRIYRNCDSSLRSQEELYFEREGEAISGMLGVKGETCVGDIALTDKLALAFLSRLRR